MESSLKIQGSVEVNSSESSYLAFPLRYAGWLVALVVGAGWPIFDAWLRHALKSDFESHTLLIPVVAAYLAWTRVSARVRTLPEPSWSTGQQVGLGICLALVAVMAWVIFPKPIRGDTLTWSTLAVVIAVWAGTFIAFGKTGALANLFSLGFLIFAVPMTGWLRDGIEIALQHASAEVSYWMLWLVQTPMQREGLYITLPGIKLEVAQECSGSRSSLVLFITSVLAGQLFLRSPWRRGILVFLVIPLAIIRNGFRVSTIALLCVHVGPHMINSWVHKKGGPLFFALSLIPFFGILFWLARGEKRKPALSHPVKNTESEKSLVKTPNS